MAPLTFAKFVTDGNYKVFKAGQSIPSRPPVLSESVLKKIRSDIIARICQNAPKRPHPGGQLSQPSMWSVNARVLKGGDRPAFAFEVKAAHEQPLETMNFIKSGDPLSREGYRYHYPWWVEFGHKVKRPKVRLPFMVQSGRIWRVQVDGWKQRKGKVGRLSYQAAKRPVWVDYGNFSPEKREMASIMPIYRKGKFANGRQYWIRTNKLRWLIPGVRTNYVRGVYFVKKALESTRTEMEEAVQHALLSGKEFAGLKTSQLMMYRRWKPTAVITEDHYEHDATLVTKMVVPSLYSFVIHY